MQSSIHIKIFKGILKTTASTILGTASEILDSLAETAEEGKDYIDSLDKKDTSAREARQTKREESKIVKGTK